MERCKSRSFGKGTLGKGERDDETQRELGYDESKKLYDGKQEGWKEEREREKSDQVPACDKNYYKNNP
ncbi:hypothetical protein RUM43_010417 [Polyplax serrata]|uniref:Uncharacterized protein n=1 Tax=Polyplax serrata TaxID=468196 RepID=A0AAN8P428_POLSC